MSKYERINGILAKSTICDVSRIVNETASKPGVTMLDIRDSLYHFGRIFNEDRDENIYVAVVKTGFFKMDSVIVAVQLEADDILFAAYMRRCLGSERICRRAISDIKSRI